MPPPITTLHGISPLPSSSVSPTLLHSPFFTPHTLLQSLQTNLHLTPAPPHLLPTPSPTTLHPSLHLARFTHSPPLLLLPTLPYPSTPQPPTPHNSPPPHHPSRPPPIGHSLGSRDAPPQPSPGQPRASRSPAAEAFGNITHILHARQRNPKSPTRLMSYRSALTCHAIGAITCSLHESFKTTSRSRCGAMT
jgi:hypothetical protein